MFETSKIIRNFNTLLKIINYYDALLRKINYPNFSIMVTTGFIITKAGVAATLAKLTGIALLANPWGAAVLTMVAMWVAGNTGELATQTVGDFFSKTARKFRVNQNHAFLYSRAAMAGMIVGLSLATVVTPGLAVLSGFLAAKANTYSDSFFKLSITAKMLALLTPLSPLIASGMLAMLSIKINKKRYKSLTIMAATGFIMTKAGVATTLAKLTGLTLLANPWGAAALTVVAMGMAGLVGGYLSNLLMYKLAFKLGLTPFDKSASIPYKKARASFILEPFFATQGLIVGLGLATVLAPWLAVVGGFSAMIAERVIAKNHNNGVIQYAGTMLSLIPFAPTAASGFALRGVAATVAMVPSAVAAWTPTLSVVCTALGSVGYAMKEGYAHKKILFSPTLVTPVN